MHNYSPKGCGAHLKNNIIQNCYDIIFEQPQTTIENFLNQFERFLRIILINDSWPLALTTFFGEYHEWFQPPGTPTQHHSNRLLILQYFLWFMFLSVEVH